MEVFADLASGFANALSLQYLLFAAIGVTIGTLVGVLPGIGPAMALALLLPLTYGFDPTGALIIFAGIYYGSLYGGAITSILLNTPGEAGSVATAIDGYPMAKAGRAGPALATAVMGSFAAGIISTLGLTLLAPAVANLAKSFQATDYFALMVLAFVSVTALVGTSIIRGLVSLFLGLFIGLIGLDFLTGQQRFTFGAPELLGGIDIVIVVIGLFAIGEALYGLARLQFAKVEEVKFEGRIWLNKAERRRVWKPWIRGGFLGFIFGSMPTGGSEVPTFLSYNLEKRLSKHPHEFGKGAIEGIAGPEAANNASFSGVMVPLLTLGIPTSATAAIILSAFQIYNIQPGPQLFENSPDLVWTLIASLFIGNIMLLIINLPLVKVWVRILDIPKPLLFTGILVFGTLGVYSLSGSVLEVIIVYVIGIVGFFMRLYDFPVAPAVLGSILGPMMETQFRRALAISQGDFSVFFTRPLTLVLLLLALAVLVLPTLLPRVLPRRTATDAGTTT
ncbi:tripartite tricarboxylate transporter permease [Crystallibacter degradans]|uniref:tripartite tricarboxylate transporter permease n=1 Tax=Crystallibacter degradans TaxID=2726743 RepID=UPI001472F7A6|nr:tripartite tricarboxylate transporter permease [Arthrobacter sp. SF27]NMR28534.1 tripartite tricarboxylate transporter permease [Arthrobacter sp. SF27]